MTRIIMPETLFTQGITGQIDTLISCDVKKLRYPHER